jgi:hypothetical protein
LRISEFGLRVGGARRGGDARHRRARHGCGVCGMELEVVARARCPIAGAIGSVPDRLRDRLHLGSSGGHRPSRATVGGTGSSWSGHGPPRAEVRGTEEEGDEAPFFGGVGGEGEGSAGFRAGLCAVVVGFGLLVEGDVGGDVGLGGPAVEGEEGEVFRLRELAEVEVALEEGFEEGGVGGGEAGKS